jgi:tetratricopeptide (TPR) repeat protein
LLLWPLLLLFQAALIAVAFRLGANLAAPETSAMNEPASDEPVQFPPLQQGLPETGPLRAAKGELDEVDRLVGVGRHELAPALCSSLVERATAGLRDAFRYRLALCLEGLGRWDQALTVYRTLASHTPSARASAVALLGQARVWLRMRRPAEAKALLCDLLRRSALPALHGQPFLIDARYLLALASALDVLPNEPPGPFRDDPVSPLTTDWALDHALDWDRGTSASIAAGAEPLAGEIIAVKPGDVPHVRIRVQHMPVAGLLDRLAEQAHWRIDWSARARQQVEDRGGAVALEGESLPDTLRLLIEPLGLVWKLEGDKLTFSSEEEAPAERLHALRVDEARRGLREAVRAHPRHPLTPAAYLELGSLEAAAGRPEDALAWYARLLREWPRVPLAIEAHYNTGLLLVRQGDRPAARQAFFRVIDRAPAHELAPLAYWRVGRLYLEEGDPAKALSPLRRAVRGGPGSAAHAAAALTIAAAYLLTDNPRATNAILLEHRELVARDNYQPAAAFLDTLARFRALTDRLHRQREANDLLAALLAVHDDMLLGPAGLALMGHAYRDLGMPDEMVRMYRKALPHLRGPLAAELSLALAEAYWAADKRGAAVDLYQKLASAGLDAGARRARLRLAEKKRRNA